MYDIVYEKSDSLDGKKVKLNYERIMKRPSSVSSRFGKFVESHKDEIFTAKDAKAGTKYTGIMYTLKEDPSPVKWLFYVDDLVLVEEER